MAAICFRYHFLLPLPSETRQLPVSSYFSGDTKPCRALEKGAKGADLLIHEATYGSEDDRAEANRWGHSTFADAAEAAVRTGAKRLWLTHLSQAIEDEAAALETARAIFPAAECPPDGHTIHLSFPEESV